MSRLKRTFGGISTYGLIGIGATLMVFPFLWMILTAFKTAQEVAATPPTFLPLEPTVQNFIRVFELAPFGQYLLNSVLITLVAVVVTQLTSILAAYGFSVLRFPGRDMIFAVLIASLVVPFELLIMTNYRTIAELGLIDTFPALVLPFMVSVFYTFIIRNTFQSVPEGLYWAARIDGASNWRYLWTVLVPIGKPTIITTSLLNGIASWNAFLWPLLVINTPSKRTLPLGLYAFITDGGIRYELLMAASTIAVLPMIVLFALASNQIIQGIARGGLKG